MIGGKKQNGFTVVELLVATTVFSMVLVIVSYSVIAIGRTFDKGIVQSRTQEAARQIMDKISQDIQLGGQPISLPVGAPAVPYALCIGSNRYSVNIGQQMVTSTRHGLVLDQSTQDSPPANCSIGSVVTNLNGGGSLPNESPAPLELLSPGMRITYLTIDNTPPGSDVYHIHLRLVYGDDDLITDGGIGPNVQCKTGSGSQFCAVADFETTVEARTN